MTCLSSGARDMDKSTVRSPPGLFFPEAEKYRDKYPTELLDRVAGILGIKDAVSRRWFEQTVLNSAFAYFGFKQAYLDLKAPESDENKALQAIANNAHSLAKAFKKSNETGVSFWRFARALNDDHVAARDDLYQRARSIFVRKLGNRIEYEKQLVEEVVLLIAATAEKALDANTMEQKARPNSAIESWLRQYKTEWKNFTGVAFTRGKYYKEIPGYKSPALDAMEQLMFVLDTDVTRQQIESAMGKIRSRSQ